MPTRHHNVTLYSLFSLFPLPSSFSLPLPAPAPGAREDAPRRRAPRRGVFKEDSGDDRLSRRSTIMGPTGLTAVFGMGTGVAPPVWSPEMSPDGG